VVAKGKKVMIKILLNLKKINQIYKKTPIKRIDKTKRLIGAR